MTIAEKKLDDLTSIVLTQLLPEIRVMSANQVNMQKLIETNMKRLDKLDEPTSGRVSKVETTQQKIIQRTLGGWFVVGLLWAGVTFVYGPHDETKLPILPPIESRAAANPLPSHFPASNH